MRSRRNKTVNQQKKAPGFVLINAIVNKKNSISSICVQRNIMPYVLTIAIKIYTNNRYS